MIRCIQDVAYPSGGVVAGVGNSAFQNFPILEGIDATVLDDRIFPAPGLAPGTLWVDDVYATNTSGDGFYTLQTQRAQQLPMFSYGVMTAAVLPPQGGTLNYLLASILPGSTYGVPFELRIRQEGTCNANVTTPSSTVAVAPGSFLCADGNGNMMPLQPPSTAPAFSVYPEGTAGSTTYGYAIYPISIDGVQGAPTLGTVTVSNATLTSANYNQLLISASTDASAYLIQRISGGATQGTIGYINSDTPIFNDYGQPAITNTTATQLWPQLSAPSAPTVAQVSGATAGTSTATYEVFAVNALGVWSAASTPVSLTTSALVLSPTQGNKITWTAVTGAVKYAIVSTARPGTLGNGVLAFSTNPTGGVIDYGQNVLGTYASLAQNYPTPNPRPGVVLGIAKGSLAAGTTTATLVPVRVGGF